MVCILSIVGLCLRFNANCTSFLLLTLSLGKRGGVVVDHVFRVQGPGFDTYRLDSVGGLDSVVDNAVLCHLCSPSSNPG